MFDDTLVVQSAVSAFNNSALFAPAFLWNAILAIPLFAIAYFYGNVFLEKLGWNTSNSAKRDSIVLVALIMIWTVLFGGNYDTLRDTTSVLPMVTAFILFTSSYFITSHMRDVKLPKITDKKWARFGILLTVLAMIGVSDLHTWWGPILQIGAVLFGLLLGKHYKFTPSPIVGALIVMMIATTALLMQPEYFRFGQLGNLTIVHLGFVMLVGALFAATISANMMKPAEKIHHSAYVKLKWLARFMCLLGCVLFVMTESVPVFLGTTFLFWGMFAMSVWHANKTPENLVQKLFALTVISFGIVSGITTIAALGIIILQRISAKQVWSELKFLL